MKRFLKLNAFALVALLFLGVADAWGLGIKKNVALNFSAEGDKGSWNAWNKQMTWTDSRYNLLFLTDWYDCDLSGYDKMVIDVQSASKDKAYRVLITIDGVNYTYSTTGEGIKTINIKKDFKNGNRTIESVTGNPLSKVSSIRIGGDSDKGNIVINSIYFHKPLEWDAQGKIIFYAPDFNVGDNVTKNANTYSFKNQYDYISLDFDNDGLAITDIESINISGTGNIHQCFRKEKNNNKPEAYDVNGAQDNKIDLGFFMIRASRNDVRFTLNSVTFTKKKFVVRMLRQKLLMLVSRVNTIFMVEEVRF